MYLRALLLGGCIALTGCQSASVVEQQPATSSQASRISQLSATQVKLPSVTRVAITANTQYLNNQTIDSPVAVFAIPADRGRMSLTITSEIKDSVFYPYAMITDEQGQVIEQYDDSSFEYVKPRLNLGNRLVADIDFFPPRGYQTLYLVVYTKKSDLDGSTGVIHPARLDAEARGNYMPEMKDIPVPHSLTGTIELEVAGPSFFSSLTSNDNAEQNVTSSDQAQRAVEAVQPDTQSYYTNAITQAVKENNLPKALGLLDEAKALGVEGAQEVFIKAVNSK
ncbi:MalM family protein [Vibrio sp. AK197]|uniref:MalM family protein n=1 Tax=Vibrio olivae TaxID=1243002 RepID=A0ABV5HMH4_9VIBR